MSGRLAGRRAVVTGAARGIGAEIARTFATEGASVAVLDVSAEGAATTAAEVGGTAHVVDLRDVAATRAALEEAVEALGGIDVLVNNAGVLRKAPLLDITTDDWDDMFAVTLRPVLVTTQVAARAMIAAGGGGAIVNMASMAARTGGAGQGHYAAAKAAVVALTRVSALELGGHGIRVNCLCPGFVLTEMGAATRTPEQVAEWTSRSPLGRLGETTDVARTALFLASDDADYLTGQAINVTGGMVM
ncbi:SDR family NAD(P)-dependent oxidoreductase [Pseudonocardia sp. 73-21]|uniref:SDR family NAD(P)-dependent oxidoreductase n=1 Tax=Pseudonocardia sp. 73-21 TaxID=1895809 RepID=UPI00260B138B|nr:SDR family NAD(P)-dependent oxidoreductase [Pseudonocardia sp. 73-21]